MPSLAETRAPYLKAWATQLNVDSDNPLVIASEVYNRKKNAETCCALAFGLSWVDERHVPYLRKATEWFKNYMAQFENVQTSPDFLYQLTSAYVTEIDADYPAE